MASLLKGSAREFWLDLDLRWSSTRTLARKIKIIIIEQLIYNHYILYEHVAVADNEAT